MYVQKISDQNFTAGKFIHVKNHVKCSGDISSHFPEWSREFNEAKKLIKGEPFDIFVCEHSSMKDFFEFNANTSYFNVINGNKNQKRIYVHKLVMKESIKDAVQDAIDEFGHIKQPKKGQRK